MAVIHYINLTNGIACIHRVRDPHYLRLQSTACEQHLWWDVMRDLGSDFIMNAALGHTLIIHDKSERKPQPRAIYQGMQWVRYALNMRWFGSVAYDPMKVYVKGVDCTRYFRNEYRKATPADKHRLDFYAKYINVHALTDERKRCSVKVYSCDEYEGAHLVDTLAPPPPDPMPFPNKRGYHIYYGSKGLDNGS